jgi:hypothetical protein
MSLNSDLDEELDEDERQGKILSAEEAAQAASATGFNLSSGINTGNTFDASKYDASTFKFV